VSDTSDPSVIESQLAATRARLGSHLDELTRRLSPGQLLDEGLSYVRNGQGAVFARNLGAQVRDNPLPVVLTGLGIAWLAAAGSLRGAGVAASRSRALVPYVGGGTDTGHGSDSLSARTQRAGDAIARSAGETEAAFHERVADARAGILGVVRQAQETAAGFAERVQQAFDAARRSAHDGMGSVEETANRWSDRLGAQARQGGAAVGDAMERGRGYAGRAGEYASQAADYAAGARDGIVRGGAGLMGAVAENPVVLGALGLAAGALLGALLPRTESEDAYLGAAAGQATAAARDMASEVVERGARVADAAMNAGYQAARDEGQDLAATHGGTEGPRPEGATRSAAPTEATGQPPIVPTGETHEGVAAPPLARSESGTSGSFRAEAGTLPAAT
jgi:hypothetical protein